MLIKHRLLFGPRFIGCVALFLSIGCEAVDLPLRVNLTPSPSGGGYSIYEDIQTPYTIATLSISPTLASEAVYTLSSNPTNGPFAIERENGTGHRLIIKDRPPLDASNMPFHSLTIDVTAGDRTGSANINIAITTRD